MRIVLASASPRRRELIRKIPDIQVKIVPSDVDEETELTDPKEVVAYLSRIKALDVLGKEGGNVVGADTVVAIDGKILTKPKSEEEAIEMLRALCGKTHEVMTGVTLACAKGTQTRVEVSRVSFAPYDDGLVRAYVASGSPMDKAGAYGIQDPMLAPLVEGVEGDLDNVIGLPVRTLSKMLSFFDNTED